jgi:acetate kinase
LPQGGNGPTLAGMNILVLNCGSSTVKFQIIQTDRQLIADDHDRWLARGIIERVGSQALITLEANGHPKERHAEPVRDHRSAIDRILRWVISDASRIEDVASLADIHAVGHRVVHGGERFQRSVRIDAGVLEGIEDCIDLAPLHNPANLKGVRAATDLLGPGVPQVAVFDTSFHSTMPEEAYLYALPYQLYRRHKIRRYGFHGTSHRYIAYRYRKLHSLEPEQVTIITLHLGNGCSACAIREGRSVATSMGFTPLEGLVMGTRSGDIDPSLIEFLMMKEGIDISEVDTLLNKRSGLLGLSGLTSDMRELLEEEAENHDRRACLAIEIFCRRVRRYIGAYLAETGPTEAVVFTGGIGENAAPVRERILAPLEHLGIRLDRTRNESAVAGRDGEITSDGSPIRAWVIPTDEELLIARDTYRVVEDIPRRW